MASITTTTTTTTTTSPSSSTSTSSSTHAQVLTKDLKTHYKYVVIGLGGIGSSTLYWLSRKSKDPSSVLGLEQFSLGHDKGGSQDHSRIIRLAYDFPEYTRLAQQAYAAWSAIETESGQQLIVQTGAIVFGPAADPHIQAYSKAMAAQGIPFESWDHIQIKEHYPQIKLKETDLALFQPDGGIIDPRKANATHISLARARGATILENVKVTQLTPIGKTGAEIRTQCGCRFTADRVVVAAGAWTNQVLEGTKTKLDIVVSQEQVTYFSTPNLKQFSPQNFPIWICYGMPGVSCFYGFPVYGEIATKAGEHEGGLHRGPTTADGRNFIPDQERTKSLVNFLSDYIPGSLGPELYTKTCLYELTPDRNFVVDMLPDYPQISVFIGAGHAFKFASILGYILAEFAEKQETSYSNNNLPLFKITRPGVILSRPSDGPTTSKL